MLEIIKVIDSKPSPRAGQLWQREKAYYLLNSIASGVVWAYKYQNNDVTEVAIDLQNSWRFKVFDGDAAAKDLIIDAMVDALYEQDDVENSDRIYELSKVNLLVSSA